MDCYLFRGRYQSILKLGKQYQSISKLRQKKQTETSIKKRKISIKLTHGVESPQKAALAFLIAKTAIEEGHTVKLFLTGDAVVLLRDQVLDNLTELGVALNVMASQKIREHYDAIVKGGGKFYLSGPSSKARGITEADIQGKPVEFAGGSVLLRL